MVGDLGSEVVGFGDPLLAHGDSGEDLSCATVGYERRHICRIYQRIELHHSGKSVGSSDIQGTAQESQQRP